MSKALNRVNYYVLICSLLTFIFLFSFTSALETSQWDYIPIGNITYQNNTYINQTLELNTTQFDTDPLTIKESWLTTFIEGISKWGNYYTKTEIDNRYSNNTGDQDLSGYVPYTGATGDVNLGNNKLGIGVAPVDNFHIFTNTTQTTPQIFVEQDGSGDAAMEFGIVGDSYIMGIDNSDADKFKISYSSTKGAATFGTNDIFTMTPAGWIGLGTNAPRAMLHTSESGNRIYIDTLHGLEADGYRIDYARGDKFGPRFIVQRSRGTASWRRRLLDNDQIFYIDGRALGSFFGAYVAQMSIEADGNHLAGSTPGKFVFKVQPSGTEALATLVNAFNIDATGTYISDGIKHYLGTAKDVSVTYNGTDTIFTNEVGSGEFQFGGVVKATGYKSSDGSAGITTTFVDADGNTIGVKDGLIVSKTAP